MSANPLTDAERLRMSFALRAQRMEYPELRGELVVGGSFAIAAALLAGLSGSTGHFSFATAALYVLCFALAGHVRFDIGGGFTVPTQVVFVPMLFVVPASAVPLLVAFSLALGMLPAIAAGRVPAIRLLTVAGNSWFAIGPALVLVLAGDRTPYGHWGILCVALAAQFTCDFTAAAVRERLRHGVPIGEIVEEVRQVYAIDLAFSALGLALAFATVAVHRQWAVLLVGPLFAVLKVFSNERHARLEQLVELNDAYQGTALLLGDVLEADDAYTGEHCRSVVRLALDVSREMGLDADCRRRVEFGALLHDVGKIAVPNEIINKAGPLDEHEWAIIKTHTIEGQRMLERIGGMMRDVGYIVRSSHERWDGGGYPDELKGQEIPLEARIVSACDAFNAMTTTRSYRPEMPLADALTELKANAGSQFDPQVVDALVRVVQQPTAAQGPVRRGYS
jgi:putative nucleotidyltransferase with HDIG domain